MYKINFRPGLCITYNFNCWCDYAPDGASGDYLDLETHFSILNTVQEEKLLIRACPVQRRHFPRTVYEFMHPGHIGKASQALLTFHSGASAGPIPSSQHWALSEGLLSNSEP